MFKARVFSSIILVAVALVTLLSGGACLAAALWAISLVAFRELCRACGIVEGAKKKGNRLERVGFLCISLYYLVMAAASDMRLLVLAVLLTLIVFLFAYVFCFPRIHAREMMGAYFSFIYAPVMFSFIYLARELSYGVYFVWMIFISSWISDTFAYVFGMLFGRHRLAPLLSPKKSVEGAAAGILGSAFCGGLFGFFLLESLIAEQRVTGIFVLVGAAGSVVSQIGDLAASAIKRNYRIKDYGSLIPGHGGIMDRFDSVIVTAPLIYFLFALLIP